MLDAKFVTHRWTEHGTRNTDGTTPVLYWISHIESPELNDSSLGSSCTSPLLVQSSPVQCSYSLEEGIQILSLAFSLVSIIMNPV